MGVQVTLKDIQSGFLSATTHTANNTLIEEALDKSLDRTSNTNNGMEVDFDMGLNEIINLAESRGQPLNAVNRQELEEHVAAIVGNAIAGLQPGAGGGDTIIVEEMGIFYRQTSAATDGQTVFYLQQPYTRGSNTLLVYINGVLQVLDIDYAETDALIVTFAEPLTTEDTVQFVYSKTITAVPTNVYQTKVVRIWENVAGVSNFVISYNPGNIDVFLNGVKLQNQEDFLAINGAEVILTIPIQDAADAIEITAYSDFSIANHYEKQEVYRKDETYSQLEAYSKLETYTQTEVNALVSQAAQVPAGVYHPYAGSTAPTGYLICDGSAISRTTYANLFSAIGESWGTGNGLTTFNIPDLRGEFVRGLDAGRGVDAGRALGSLQADELESHDHISGITWYAGAFGTSPVVATNVPAGSNSLWEISPNTSTTGGTETRPRNVASPYIIKY